MEDKDVVGTQVEIQAPRSWLIWIISRCETRFSLRKRSNSDLLKFLNMEVVQLTVCQLTLSETRNQKPELTTFFWKEQSLQRNEGLRLLLLNFAIQYLYWTKICTKFVRSVSKVYELHNVQNVPVDTKRKFGFENRTWSSFENTEPHRQTVCSDIHKDIHFSWSDPFLIRTEKSMSLVTYLLPKLWLA